MGFGFDEELVGGLLYDYCIFCIVCLSLGIGAVTLDAVLLYDWKRV